MNLVDKYRPRSVAEVQGHNKAVQEILAYLERWKPKTKALLLHGPPGVGKTSVVYAIAEEKGLELIEVNASDYRNPEQLQTTVGAASKQQSLFFKKKIILIDEVDGLAGREDRGGTTEIVKLVRESKYPIILTANEAWHKKLSGVRNACQLIELKKLNYTSILAVLKKVCQKENISCEEKILSSLARKAGGDLRGALTDLQVLATTKINLENVEELGVRKKTEKIFTAMMKIFKTTDPEISRRSLDNLEENTDELFLWMAENYPIEYKKAKDRYEAAEVLSKADLFRRRIRKRQHWRFLAYITDYLSAGVSLAKEEKYFGFTPYKRTQRILKIWRANQTYAKRKSISQKIGKVTRTSSKKILQDTLPCVQLMTKKGIEFPEFELTEDEITWLKK